MDNLDKNSKYAYLSQLSTQELESILRADLENDDSELAEHVMEVIAARENTEPEKIAALTRKAWEEFQTIYNTPEGKGRVLYPTDDPLDPKDPEDQDDPDHPDDPHGSDGPKEQPPQSEACPERISYFQRFHHHPRRILAVAAAAAIILMFLVPPALGYQSFYQMVGSWTDSLFQFQKDGTPIDTEDQEKIQQVLSENGIPTWIVPTVVPDGFELDEIKVFDQPKSDEFEIHVFYNNDSHPLSISVRHYNEQAPLKYEKDVENVQKYLSNGMSYYLFENKGHNIAAWNIDEWECAIYGDVSIDELKIMVDSIKER